MHTPRELWEGRTVNERAAFVAERFAEARIAADGGVESAARETYFAIVAAAWHRRSELWALLGSNQ